MLKGVGLPELLIVALVVVLIFGVGRLGKLGKELGTGISEFRKGLKSSEEETAAETESTEEEKS